MGSFYTKIGNIEAILWCSIGSVLIGLILMIVGAIVTGIAYSEITPPDYDKLYDRYTGANIKRVTGVLALCFGGIIMIGSCSFFVMAFVSERRSQESGRASKHHYNSKQAMNPQPEDV